MEKQVELLAPAGSYESLRAAVAAGADAVYVGGTRFGARAYANNLDEENMCRAIDFAHLHGAKVFMTVNTLLKDAELEELPAYLRPYYLQGLDGVIIQDLGVFARIREEFPGLALHASTQMTLLGAPGAALLKSMGASRIVPARELSLAEIREIKQKVNIEVETFVHGALCYCYSGQCLFSSMLGGRSGNRGRCAQPCRLPYQIYGTGKDRDRLLSARGEEYVLSPKDMCTVELIPEMVEAGIDSFKIEGRMKRPEYTAGVVSVYRKYIDLYMERGREQFRVEKEDMEKLLALYNRGGFSEGYYHVKNGRKMISLVRPNHFEEKSREALRQKQKYEALLAELNRTYVEGSVREKIQGNLRISKEGANVFEVKCRGIEVRAEGEPAQEPKNHPMTEEQIRRSMEKTGNTPFVWEDLQIRMDGPVFVPVQALNDLRRRGLEELERKICEGARREMPERTEPGFGEKEERMEALTDEKTKPLLRVQLEEPDMLSVVLEEPAVDAVYLSCGTFLRQEGSAAGLVQRCREAGKACYLVMPDIFRSEDAAYWGKRWNEVENAGFDGLLLKNLEEVQFVKERAYAGKWIPDANLYAFNRETRKTWADLGAAFAVLPLELNERELALRGCRGDEMIVYGYQPLMVTANCAAKTLGRCRKQREWFRLEDRYHKRFALHCICENCHNVIYNSTPLYLIDCTKEISRLQPASLRLQFTMESEQEIRRILKEAAAVFREGKQPSAFGKDFTRGHLKRGVE